MINSELEVSNYFANIRTDNNTVLGVFGKDYQIVQNREAFSFFDAIVGGNSGILYETAVGLGNGERILLPLNYQITLELETVTILQRNVFSSPPRTTGAEALPLHLHPSG